MEGAFDVTLHEGVSTNKEPVTTLHVKDRVSGKIVVCIIGQGPATLTQTKDSGYSRDHYGA